MTATKTTTKSKFTGIYKGFVYKDFVGGELLIVEKVTDESVIFDNGLEVTNLDAFELLKLNYDSEDLSSRQFDAQDGELFMDGVRVETGTLYIEEVLFTSAPRVGLKVRSLQEGKHDLFVYDFIKDHFAKTSVMFDKVLENEEKIKNLRVIRLLVKEETILPESKVDLELLNDKVHYTTDGNTYTFVYEFETILVFVNGNVVSSTLTDVSDKSQLVEYDGELILVQQSKTTEETLSFQEASVDVSVTSDRVAISEVIISPVKDEDENLTNVSVKGFDTLLRKGDKVESIGITNSDNNSLLIVTEKGFVYSNNGFTPRHAEGKVAKEAVKDYPYFIRLKAGNHRNVFTLANDKRETIDVEVVKTQDRGYTTNII